jgi:hypothetical protein
MRPALAREALDQQPPRFGQFRQGPLPGQPIGGVAGQGMGVRIGQHRLHPVRQQGGGGHLDAHEDGDLRLAAAVAADLDGHLAQDS